MPNQNQTTKNEVDKKHKPKHQPDLTTGQTHQRQGNFNLALDHYHQALTLAQEQDNPAISIFKKRITKVGKIFRWIGDN